MRLPEDLQIIVNDESGWLADLYLAAAAAYGGLGGTKTVDASFVYSDHGPFWDNGYPALLAIEDEPLTNPYYHQTSDTLDKLNLDFFTSATRTSVGLLAELAQPIKDGYPRTPVGLSGRMGRLQISLQFPRRRPPELGRSGRCRGVQRLSHEHVPSRLRQDQYDARDRHGVHRRRRDRVGDVLLCRDGGRADRSRGQSFARERLGILSRRLLDLVDVVRSIDQPADAPGQTMRGLRLAAGFTAFALGLATAAPAQELSLSFGSGGFFPTAQAYRAIYGTGVAFAADVWFKLKGPLGLTTGFGHLSDDGLALAASGGSEPYPVKFRRRTIPMVLFYQLDIGPVDVRAGAGAALHSFRETWQTVDLDYSGNKIGPRFLLTGSFRLIDRLSFFCSLTYDPIHTAAASPVAFDVRLGGVQIIGGLAFRIF